MVSAWCRSHIHLSAEWVMTHGLPPIILLHPTGSCCGLLFQNACTLPTLMNKHTLFCGCFWRMTSNSILDMCRMSATRIFSWLPCLLCWCPASGGFRRILPFVMVSNVQFPVSHVTHLMPGRCLFSNLYPNTPYVFASSSECIVEFNHAKRHENNPRRVHARTSWFYGRQWIYTLGVDGTCGVQTGDAFVQCLEVFQSINYWERLGSG
jgi:hypothetical protein